MINNQPFFKVKSSSKEGTISERLAIDIEEAREDVKKGRLYTAEQVRKEIGL